MNSAYINNYIAPMYRLLMAMCIAWDVDSDVDVNKNVHANGYLIMCA